MTFWSLLRQNIEYSNSFKKVVIPIIQRPYTQGGRPDSEEIKNKGRRFCEFLVDCLLKDGTADVNIVYGAEKGHVIELLDGQQRMTTLFLIYWYVSQKMSAALTDTEKGTFKRFTYETRVTTRRFFEAIVVKQIERSSECLSKDISKQGWFNPLWKNDQSVMSALGMIDMIEETFTKGGSDLPYDSYWERLTDPENCPFVFSYTTLERLNQSDDLYIKMNARGKQLTPFENFKAGLEKIIEDNALEGQKNISETFGHKIDTNWTDIFWDMRDNDANIDKYMLAFITSSRLLYLATHKKNQAKEEALILFNNIYSIEPECFEKESFNALVEDLNAIEKVYKSGIWSEKIVLRIVLNDKEHKEITLKELFSLACTKNLYNDATTRDSKLNWLLLAYLNSFLLYAKRNENLHAGYFGNWLRVSRNILENTTVDSYETLLTVIDLFDGLCPMEGAETYQDANGEMIEFISNGDVYKRLREFPIQPKSSADQVKEEILKAHLRESESTNSVFSDLEDTYIAHGKISFFLNCGGVKAKDDVVDLELFEKYVRISKDYLLPDVTDKFRAAMFTIDDHLFYNYWHSYNYFLQETKYRIIAKDEINIFIKKDPYKKYLKGIISSLIDNDCDIDSLLDTYEDDGKYPWIDTIVKNPGLLEKSCKSKCITVSNDGKHCYLLNVGRASFKEDCKEIK